MLNTKELTDKALMEEASRYTTSHSRPLFLLGKRDFSCSFTLSGRDGVIDAIDGGCGRGCSSKTIGGADLGPLRLIGSSVIHIIHNSKLFIALGALSS